MSLIVVINGVDDLANAELVEKKAQETFFSEYFYDPVVVVHDFIGSDDGDVSAGFLFNRAKDIVHELHKLFRQKKIGDYRLIAFFAHNAGAALVKQILLYSIESVEYGWIARQTMGMHFIEAQSYTNRTQWEKYLFRLLAVKRLPVSDLAAIVHTLPDQLACVQMQFSSIAQGFRILVTNRSSGVYLRSEDPWYFGKDRSKQTELIEAVESMIGLLRYSFKRINAQFKEIQIALCRPEAVTGRINTSFVDPEYMAWVKSHDEYKKWLDGKDSSLLSVTGPSGSGKSSVASHILYTLQTENVNPQVLFLSFSFSRWDITRNSEWDLVASLIRQLLFLKPSIIGKVPRMLDLVATKERISKAYIWGFFHHLCSVSGLSTIFLVIDTVDQCKEPISDRILSLLATAQTTPALKILTTGLYVIDTAAHSSVQCLSLENLDWSTSIHNAARARVSHIVRKRLVWRDKQEEIVEKMCGANVNYLRTMTNLDLLEYSIIPSTKSALQERLRSPFLSLEEVFATFLKTVHESTSATMALHWIYYSLRPLTLPELSVALTLSLDPERYATKTATFEDLANQVSWDLMGDLGNYLGQVVKIIDDRAMLVHHTFCCYLEKQEHIKATTFHALAARSCISYINLCSEEAADEEIKNARLSRSTIGVASSLLDYAQFYWAHHYEPVQGIDAALDNTVLEFLTSSIATDLSDTDFDSESNRPKEQDTASDKTEDHANDNSSGREENPDTKNEPGEDAADKNGDGDGYEPQTGEEISGPVVIIPQSAPPSISSDSAESSADSGFAHSLPPSTGWAKLCKSLYGWPEMVLYGPIFLSIQLGLGHITQMMLRNIGDTTESDKRRIQNSIGMAASKRDIHLLDLLLEKRQKSDHPNSSLKNAMSLAAGSGNVNILERILEAAADTADFEEIKRGVGVGNPLLVAARCGFTEMVELLLSRGFDLLMTSAQGLTAVSLACKLGSVKTLKAIQRLQSEKFKQTLVMTCKEDKFPLQYVCMSGIDEAFDFVKEFAPPEQLTQVKDMRHTPVQLCAMYGHTGILNRLIKAGVDILAGVPCPLPDVFSYDDSVRLRDWTELAHITALEIVTRNYHEDCGIQILNELSRSEEGKEIPEAEAERRKAMLDSALFEAVSSGHLNLLELLLQRTKRDPVVDGKHIRICCGRGHLQALKMLMAAGISIQASDGEYNPYLDLAISEINLDVVRFLIDNGLRSEWDGNETSIQYAARRGYIVALRLMLNTSDPEHILRETATNHTAHQLSALACQVEAFKELWAWEQEYLKKVNESSHDSHDSHDERSESSASPPPGQISVRRPAWALNLAIASTESDEPVIKFVEYLLNEGWDPNIPDKDVLPLHWAIRWRGLEIIQMLLDNGADPNATSQRGENAVYVAASVSSEDTILRLLDKGGDINARADNECAPIHVAVSRMDTMVVRLLLGLNRPVGTTLPVANPAALGPENKTPLHLAVSASLVVESLLEAKEKLGAQIDIDAVDKLGRTPLIEASISGVDQTIIMLLEQGANPNARDNNNQTTLHYLAYEIFARFDDGKNLIRQLCGHGADVNAVGGTFGPVLCAYIWDFKGNMDFIKLLFELGATAKHSGLVFGTPLHMVVLASSDLEWAADEFIPLMVEHGADVNAVDKYGRTVLLYCALKWHEPVVSRILFKLQADPNIADHLGATPLHYAVAIPSVADLVPQLFEAGARVDGLDNCGRSVLYKALLTRDEQSSASFDAVLARIPEADKARQMAAVLPAAVKARNNAAVKRILDVVGTDVNAVDRSGWTALDIAECYEATDMIQMLTERGAKKGTDIKTPTRMSDSDRGGDILVSEDGTVVSLAQLEVRHYYDESNSASVRADHCIPLDKGIFYFEVEISECGSNCGIAVGLTGEAFPLTEMAGWRTGTWGYHNDDGGLLHNDSLLDTGPSFNTESVVGVAYDPETQKLWFSVEGVPVACKSWAERKPEEGGEEGEERGSDDEEDEEDGEKEKEEEKEKKEEEEKEEKEEDADGVKEDEAEVEEPEQQTPIPVIGQLYPTVSFQQPWIYPLRARVNFGPQHAGGQPFRYDVPTAVPS